MNTPLLFLNDLARFLRTEFGTDRYPVGECLGKPSDLWPDLVGEVGGGHDRAEPGKVRTHARVAIVGVINPALIREVHGRGVSLYLTGQYRKETQKAVYETGMAVIAIGHYRAEAWGLRALGTLLHERWERPICQPSLSIHASSPRSRHRFGGQTSS